MSLYNEILTGRFNRALQKFFGIKGGPPAPQLTSEISVAVNLFWGAECRYLESWNRFGAGFDVAAVAANSGAVRMRNPAASAVVAVFEKISIACVTAAGLFDMQNGPSTTDLATGLGNFAGARLDPRGVGTPT